MCSLISHIFTNIIKNNRYDSRVVDALDSVVERETSGCVPQLVTAGIQVHGRELVGRVFLKFMLRRSVQADGQI